MVKKLQRGAIVPKIEKQIKVKTISGVLFFDKGESWTANYSSIFPEIRGFESPIEVKFTLEFPAVEGYYFADVNGEIVPKKKEVQP